MSTDYAEKAAKATRLIEKFGREDVVLMSYVKPTDYKEDGTYTPHLCSAVRIDYIAEDIRGTTILITDSNIFVSVKGLTVKPKPDDHIEFPDGGETYVIKSVKTFAPAGTAVFYDIQAR